MAHYHPADELLMSFAAGQQRNALGLMVACHLEQCAQCRAQVHRYEAVGGELLDTLTPVTPDDHALRRLLAQLDAPEPVPVAMPAMGPVSIPRPIRRYVPAAYDELKWGGMTRSIREFTLPIRDDIYTAKFYRIAAGKELPVHTHRGHEFTLVMTGSFSDDSGDYHAGDFILADTTTTHQPRAWDDQDCICFAVMDAPLKMTGFFGRLLNPFLR